MRLALYQPDQPPNTGTMLRMAACLDVAVDVIEPCGFPFSLRGLRRWGLDYLNHVSVHRHMDWPAFEDWRRQAGHRLVLLTTKADLAYTKLIYRKDDILLVGQESAGVPAAVHDAADARVVVPMAPALRSLNVAVAAAMVLGEALRQTERFRHPAMPTEETVE